MTCGPDEIPVAVVKRVKQEIAGPMSSIINKSVDYGKYPQKLKESKVIPIHKDKNSFKINYLGPLAITFVFSKLFDTEHYSGMTDFLTHRKSISKSQHVYVKGRSCQTAILDLTLMVHENLAMNREVVVLFLDLSKAFNCVDTLLAKLDKHGLRGKFSPWIKSFLKDRPQYVEIKDD